MNKPQLLQSLAAKSDCNQREVDAVLNALAELVQEEVLEKGDTITLVGIGTFKQKQTAPKTGRNPRTGEAVSIPAKTKVDFKITSALKG